MSDEASTPRRRLRDHGLARRPAQQEHRGTRHRRRHLHHARGPPGDLLQDVGRRQPLRRRELLDGLRRRHGLHRRHAEPAGRLERTTTILDTGLGNDAITVTLDAATDGFFVLETSGGATTGDAIAHALPAVQDNDNVNASGSSLQLVIIGGFGNDVIRGGSGNDIILGDTGIVQYVDAPRPSSPSSASAAAAT